MEDEKIEELQRLKQQIIAERRNIEQGNQQRKSDLQKYQRAYVPEKRDNKVYSPIDWS